MAYTYEYFQKSADYVKSRVDFTPEIAIVLGSCLGPFAQQIEDYQAEAEELAQSGGSTGSDSYVLVTLTAGQTMQLEVGCELMLRVGTATVNAGTSPALIDIATGGSIDNGASLVKNHLYMATIPDRTLTPTAETVKLLVRGGYSVV
jgi:hypothetical protein